MVLPLSPGERWSVVASSQEGEHAPELAVDGSRVTRWSSAFENNQWWMVDFGRVETIGAIRIEWEAAFAGKYRVLVSTDGEEWLDVFSQDAGGGGTEIIRFEPRSARFIKLDLLERATPWGFSIHEITFNPMNRFQGDLFRAVTASSGTRDYAPELAVDGKATTRWSSDFADDQWWQVEFKKSQRIGGMNIQWETAFAEKYTVKVSNDGENWTTVYNVEEGDGRTDLLFFEPVEARFLRIHCIQRGTGWGNSIWEIFFFLGDHTPRLSASSTSENSSPSFAMDGRHDRAWVSGADGEPSLTVELPEVMSLGGIVLKWLENFAVEYDVQFSENGESWTTLVSEQNGNGGFDYHYFPASDARFARMVCRRSSGAGFALAGIEFKGGDEQATPIRHYMAKARDANLDLFPMWLNRLQEFWTVVGLPEEEHETLLGESGMIEPKKGSFGVQPFIMKDGRLITWADVRLEQRLEDEILPLPGVIWNKDDWSLDIAAVMSGPAGARYTAVRYRLENRGDRAFTGKLALAIRPIQLNPGWQHGGYSPVNHAQFMQDDASAVTWLVVDDRRSMAMPVPPDEAGAAPLSEGDVGDYLRRGEIPAGSSASDTEGKVSAGIVYNLEVPAGASKDIVVLFPLYPEGKVPRDLLENPSAAFDAMLAEKKTLWAGLLASPKIDIPEKRLIDVMKSNLGYVMINRDGPWFKPGPRNYNHAWMRDGVLTGLAVMRCGDTTMVREFIVNFAKHIRADGWVPWMILEHGRPVEFNADPNSGEGHEYDSQGQFPFIVRQYLDYSGDEQLARVVYPKVVAAIRYARLLRERRMTDAYRDDDALRPYFGILPLSNSHEGYYPAKHSHWDNFWLLRGLKDAAYLADRLGHEDDAKWIREEEADARSSIYASIRETIRRSNMQIIPGCVELADTDPTSTSIAIMIADEANHLPQPYGTNTFDFYWDELESRMQPGGEKLFTPYEVRNADVFVRLGWRERALAALRYFTRDSTRPHAWNHMAEVVHVNPRAPAYIGDMPHTWVGSDYINAVRSMFAYEDGDALVIAAGIDPAWLDKGVSVDDLPTQFGPVSYRMAKRDGVIDITWRDEERAASVIIPWPESLTNANVVVNGQPHKIEDGIVRLR